MTLFRGMADDLVLAGVAARAHLAGGDYLGEPDFVRDGALLSIAEMLKSGTTCFNDMYFFPDVVARAAAETGIRACIGLILIDFPTAWAQTAQEYLDKGLALHDELRHSGLVRTAFAPHAPYTVSDAPLEKVRSWPTNSTCRCTCTCTRPRTRSRSRLRAAACAHSSASTVWDCSTRICSPCT